MNASVELSVDAAHYRAALATKAVNPNAASRMSREQVGEALLQLYRDSGNTGRRAEWESKLRN